MAILDQCPDIGAGDEHSALRTTGCDHRTLWDSQWLQRSFNGELGTATQEKALMAQKAVHFFFRGIPIDPREEIEALE